MDSPSQRPSSALARGIRITEFSDGRVNPDPIAIEESDILLEEFLSPRKLRDLTGVENLDEVLTLEMKVDTRDTSLGNFGTHLPNLNHLKLSNSIIQSVRDLGSGLDFLSVLWMSRCGLEDLDSISSMHNLKELYLSYNEIVDVSPCSMLENLEILDLEGNNIDDISQVEFLAMCQSLANLTLEGNPVCVTPGPDQAEPEYNFRESVQKAIPHLRILDDESLAAGPMPPASKKASVADFEDDWRLIDELLKDATIGISDDEDDVGGRPATAAVKPQTGYRPGSALRPYTNAVRPGTKAGRPGSAIKQPGSAARPKSTDSNSRPSSGVTTSTESTEPDQYDSSQLTVGAVVCGNPSKALKARLRPQTTSSNTEIAQRLQEIRKQPQHVIDAKIEPDENFKEILDEVSEWKNTHQKVLEDIEASKAAQVFVVNHDDDAVSVSGDESFSSPDEEETITPYGPGRGHEPPPRIARFAPENYAQAVRPKSGRPSSRASPLQLKSRESSYHMHDECHEAKDDGYFSRRTPDDEQEDFPSKGDFKLPTPPPRRLRSPSPVLKKPDVRKKLVSPANPLRERPPIAPNMADKPMIRSTVDSPPTSALRSPPGQQLSKIRKGHLANVQLLPSRPPNFKK